MKKFLLTLTLALGVAAAQAQMIEITAVNPNTKSITLTNYGLTTINLSNYQFCSLFEYDPLSAATVETGSINLTAGSSVTVTWTGGPLPIGGADLALYIPGFNFSNPANMLSFVQWGSGGNGRESEAGQAGIWEPGTFVSGTAPYTYIGNGTTDFGVEFWQNSDVPPPTTDIVINEVDSNTPGTDILEFVELYGEPNESLDGMVLVFYNGSNDQVIQSFDLTGFSLDVEGFFVLGNAGISQVEITFDDNTLQNGADAVALHFGDIADFAAGMLVTTDDLIDALVYDNDHPDDAGLLVLLNPGQPQVNEDTGGDAILNSNSRVPDGGIQRNTDTYAQQAPTPGATNFIAPPTCAGGTISFAGGGTTETVCTETSLGTLSFDISGQLGSAYLFLITDEANTILTTTNIAAFDFLSVPEGTCRVWGLAHNGNLVAATAEPGDNASGVETDGDCLELSAGFLEVVKENCSIPAIGFVNGSTTVNEDAGTITVSVALNVPAPEAWAVQVSVTGGTATNPDDYTTTAPINMTYPMGTFGDASVEITIMDDDLTEGDETIILTLFPAAGDPTLGTTQHTVTISANDAVVPELNIEEVTGLDANGVANVIGLECILSGTVYGVNLRPGGLEFTLIDATDGIAVFLTTGNMGYTVQEGDAITVQGAIAQFNGLTQIIPTAITLISSDNALEDPIVATALDETTESALVRINCVSLVNPADWTNIGSGFNVAITDGTANYTMRIDGDIDIFGTPPPDWAFNLVGIGSQFDPSAPHNSGYQILPRYLTDMFDPISAGFGGPVLVGTGNETVNFEAWGPGPGAEYTWDFGDGTPTVTTDESTVIHTYSDEFIMGNTTVDVTLTATNADGTCSVQSTVTFDVLYTGIEEQIALLKIFPNPSTGLFFLESTDFIETAELFNALGQRVMGIQKLNPGRTVIDHSTAAPGLYSLRVVTRDQATTISLVVE